MVNLTVLSGELSGPPEVRVLESGSRLAVLALRVGRPAGRGVTSVPVAAWDPPASVEGLGAGDPLVVVGAVERRFFRGAGGRTGSRVEVVAHSLHRPTERRRIVAALRRARDRLADLEGGADT